LVATKQADDSTGYSDTLSILIGAKGVWTKVYYTVLTSTRGTDDPFRYQTMIQEGSIDP
jgi:hypothetical protein